MRKWRRSWRPSRRRGPVRVGCRRPLRDRRRGGSRVAGGAGPSRRDASVPGEHRVPSLPAPDAPDDGAARRAGARRRGGRLSGGARAPEAAGFLGIAGMDHLAPPMAEDQPMYEAFITNTWIAAHTEKL